MHTYTSAFLSRAYFYRLNVGFAETLNGLPQKPLGHDKVRFVGPDAVLDAASSKAVLPSLQRLHNIMAL